MGVTRASAGRRHVRAHSVQSVRKLNVFFFPFGSRSTCRISSKAYSRTLSCSWLAAKGSNEVLHGCQIQITINPKLKNELFFFIEVIQLDSKPPVFLPQECIQEVERIPCDFSKCCVLSIKTCALSLV